MFENATKNQHYLPRVEQKLNALNPSSTTGNFKIYSFRLVDREKYQIALENQRGRSIDKTLSMLDLFSFEVPGGGAIRLNLEELFHKYEHDVEAHTMGLLGKLARADRDIKAEIVDLFAAKLLNFVRNPFCIQKVLNSFPRLTSYDPTAPGLLATYRKILTGRRPHQSRLCAQLGISDDTYTEWLRVLFMLLTPLSDGQPTLFEGVIKGLFESRDTQASAFVSIYDNDRCLLSDRGFSQPIPDGANMAMSFNLCSTAFVDFVFSDPGALLQGQASPEFLAMALSGWKRRPQATINVTVLRNHRDMLARYNRRVIEQCYERVYCSTKDGIILRNADIVAS
jgi:hypothetical protein